MMNQKLSSASPHKKTDTSSNTVSNALINTNDLSHPTGQISADNEQFEKLTQSQAFEKRIEEKIEDVYSAITTRDLYMALTLGGGAPLLPPLLIIIFLISLGLIVLGLMKPFWMIITMTIGVMLCRDWVNRVCVVITVLRYRRKMVTAREMTVEPNPGPLGSCINDDDIVDSEVDNEQLSDPFANQNRASRSGKPNHRLVVDQRRERARQDRINQVAALRVYEASKMKGKSAVPLQTAHEVTLLIQEGKDHPNAQYNTRSVDSVNTEVKQDMQSFSTDVDTRLAWTLARSDPHVFDVEVKCDDYPMGKIGRVRKHPHPVLHAGRQYYEEQIYRELVDAGKCVIDVGGTLKRHSEYHRVVHSMQPTIFDYDAQKNRNDAKLVNKWLTMCEHVADTSGPCKCCMKLSPRLGFMSIDSVYYLDPETIAAFVVCGPFLALHHSFAQPFGTFGKEGQYTSCGKDVIMTVSGNKTTYRHGNLHWMNNPVNTKHGWLVSQTKQVDVYRWQTEFLLLRDKPKWQPVLDQIELILDSKSPINALIEGAPNVARPIVLDVWGDYLLNDVGLMSSAAYHAVRSTIVGKNRDRESLQLCYNVAKKAHSKIVGFPVGEVDRSITLAAVLGFCANVSFETGVAENKLIDSAADRSYHATVMSDQASWIERMWHRIKTLASRMLGNPYGQSLCAMVMYCGFLWLSKKLGLRGPLSTCNPVYSKMSRWIQVAGNLLLAPVVEEAAKRIVPSTISKLLVSTTFAATEAMVVNQDPKRFCHLWAFGTVAHFLLSVMPYIPAVATHSTFNLWALMKLKQPLSLLTVPLWPVGVMTAIWVWLRPTIATGSVIVHGRVKQKCTTVMAPLTLDQSITVGDVIDGKDQEFDHIALGFSNCVPVVFNSNSTNELAALQCRVYGNPLVAETTALNSFLPFVDMANDRWLKIPYCPMDHNFENHAKARKAWNSVHRFTKHAVKMHDEAYDKSLWGLVPSNHVRTLFIKKEKKNSFLPDSCEEERDPGDPRHIQSVSPEVLSNLGPFIYAWSKSMAELWSAGNWITYAAGCSGVELYEALPDSDVYFVGDLSRFDRSIHPLIMNAFNRIKNKHCLPNHARQCLEKQLSSVGYTMKGGHRYTMKGQRKSGDANTSCDNSELNTYMHLWAIAQQLHWTPQQCEENLKIIVMGDDIVISGPKQLSEVDFKKMLATIGFTSKPKFVFDKWEVEFCSKWFWQVGDSGCLASKPGRQLARMGYSHLNTFPGDLAGLAKGLLVDNGCVPFLRPYLERISGTIPKFEYTNLAHLNAEMVPDDTTYAQLFHLYGVTQHDEVNFRKWLLNWKGGPAVGTNDVVTVLMTRDL